MLELPRCRRLPRSMDPFEVEVQESSVLIKSKQSCQHFFGRWSFVILIGNLQQCTILVNGFGKKTFQASSHFQLIHCWTHHSIVPALPSISLPWMWFFHGVCFAEHKYFSLSFAKSGGCCLLICQILSPEQHSDISVIRKFPSNYQIVPIGLSMGTILKSKINENRLSKCRVWSNDVGTSERTVQKADLANLMNHSITW